MTDRMTEQEIDALCEALNQCRSPAFDYEAGEYPLTVLATRALTAIRQLQQPWRGIESADVTAERDRYKAALEAIENGTMPRPIGEHWFPDNRPSKHDSCIHRMFMWEPCESCYDAFVGSVLRDTPTPPETER